MTHFLKFADEAQAKEVMMSVTYPNVYIKNGTVVSEDRCRFFSTDKDGNPEWITASHEHALDIIGPIYKPTGNMIETEMGEMPEMAPIDGFHINFIGELPEAVLPFVVEPKNPSRVFA